MVFNLKIVYKLLVPSVALVFSAFSSCSYASGGIALGATRVIYTAGASQTSLTVNNTDNQSVFLLQSWVEDANGVRSNDFIVTPPLFVINPQKENTLRIVYSGSNSYPQDKESLYWMNVKAIPSVNKELKGQNTLQLAILNRIKLFVRPNNLSMKAFVAPQTLRFHISDNKLEIKNPSPYFLTLSNLAVANIKLPNTMVAPKSTTAVSLPQGTHGEITYSTINDYGATTAIQKGVTE